MKSHIIRIYTDGACSGNPGPGGYGIVMTLAESAYTKTFSEGYRWTTNNRMELLALIEALKKIKIPKQTIEVYTDSKYISDSITKNWVEKWRKKAYKDVKNPDLWDMYLQESKKHTVRIFWIKGHSNHPQNDHADKLAVAASKAQNKLVDTYYENQKKYE